VIGYRKKVVFNNLKASFPKKSELELDSIMKKFYSHLCDVIVESIKGFTISEKQLRKRLIIRNPNLINELANNNQSVILVGGHINNWEICAQAVPFYSTHECVAIFKPLSNKFFNAKITNSREKYGLILAPMKETRLMFNQNEIPRAIIFGSDQSPSNPSNAYWMDFLNQETGVLFGTEKYAKEYNWPVVYVRIFKMKRGYYEVEYELITDNPQLSSHGEITESFTKMIEKDILSTPQYWLWSHKRWKHKKPKNNSKSFQ
jgi:KDO2-lipid IV(A) lauroyltransferase